MDDMKSSKPSTFKIIGMDCAEEVAILKRAVGPIVGGEEHLAFDILNGKMIVAQTATVVAPDAIVAAVRSTGMRAEPFSADHVPDRDTTLWTRWGRTLLAAVSGLAVAGGFLAHVLLAGIIAAVGSEGFGVAHVPPAVVRVLYGVAIVTGSWFVAPKAWYAARALRPDMNLLMTIAVAGAVGIGEWFEAATVAFLFAASLALEAWSVGRARRAIEALLALTPPMARVFVDGGVREVQPSEVPVGSRLLVKPGERIPLDGRVTRGVTDVNQAPITGESVPVPKDVGAPVFAGTINGNGSIEVETTRLVADTTLAGIIRMVGEASTRRAPSEQWVERFARIYTPAILAFAVGVVLIPPLVFGASWPDWIYRALVFLVIGCPCALVISTPVSIVASLAAAARQGVLVKGGAALEVPAKLRVVAVDKTGTLTRGQPEVQEVVALAGHTERELLERVAGLEAHSEHPLARAILTYASAKDVRPLPVEGFHIIQGKGATGLIAGVPYWVGSHRYLEERGAETPDVHARLQAMANASRSVIVVGNDQHVCGLIAVADAVRPEASSVVASLRAVGVQHVVMLTGDNRATADAIGAQTGVTEVRAELLPGDKVSAVESLVSQYGPTAMVGDGVNDAPAMARADLGVAMGAAGSDAAIETADVALMSDDLSKLSWLISHSRRTLAIIRQNISLSLGVKVLFAVLTFVGVASLWGAIAADMGVSLVVIANALRLLRAR